MTMLEIVLLLIGIICIAVSFMFSVKLDGTEKTQSTGTKLSDNQKEDIRRQITSVFNEQTVRITQTVEDRTRDELERLSNQKIKEFAEYSDTVLGEINKSHNEVMFLYDMLNEKSKEVHNNIRDRRRLISKKLPLTERVLMLRRIIQILIKTIWKRRHCCTMLRYPRRLMRTKQCL